MHRQAALRLKPGDRIMFGHSMWSAQVDAWGSAQLGEVEMVTKRGGILVCLIRNGRVTGKEQWVPYHHVIKSYRRPVPRPRPDGAWNDWGY